MGVGSLVPPKQDRRGSTRRAWAKVRVPNLVNQPKPGLSPEVGWFFVPYMARPEGDLPAEPTIPNFDSQSPKVSKWNSAQLN